MIKNFASIFRSVSAAFIVSCVLCVQSVSAAGKVFSWGGGQTTPPASLTNVTAISCSVDHSLARLANGAVVAWGNDMDGQCDVPPGLTNVAAVAAGEFFSLALRSNGTVVAWGSDDSGQCDLPTNLVNVTAISAGHAHAIAMKSDGSVVVWGSGAFGQTNVPSNVTHPLAVLAAGNYCVALLTGNKLVAWGIDDAGQLDFPSNLPNIISLAGNKSYVMALLTGGTVAAWGAAPPVPAGLANVKAIAAGEYHSLAALTNGSVVAWGANQSGETSVPTVTGATAVGGGWSYSLALAQTSMQTPVAVTLVSPFYSQGTFSVSFPSQVGASYALQYSTALGGGWTDLSPLPGTGGVVTATDSSASSAQRFYRVREQ